MEEENIRYDFKVLVLGEPSVGKTSFVNRIIDGTFSADYKSTIGIAFHTKVIQWGQDTKVVLQLWDVAGQQRIAEQLPIFFRDARGLMILYDLTEDETLNYTDVWLSQARKMTRSTVLNADYSPPAVLLGNKLDLLEEPDEQSAFARVSEFGYVGGFQCSTKNNKGLKEPLTCLITHMIAEEAKFRGKEKDTNVISLSTDEESQEFSNSARSGCGC